MHTRRTRKRFINACIVLKTLLNNTTRGRKLLGGGQIKIGYLVRVSFYQCLYSDKNHIFLIGNNDYCIVIACLYEVTNYSCVILCFLPLFLYNLYFCTTQLCNSLTKRYNCSLFYLGLLLFYKDGFCMCGS